MFKTYIESLYSDIKKGILKTDFNPFTRWKQHIMSSKNIILILCKAVERMSDDCAYLCYGVFRGGTLLPIALDNPNKKCVGLDSWAKFDDGKTNEKIVKDMIFENKIRNIALYSMDYEDFFKKYLGEKIGVYFVDGDHDYGATIKAMELAMPHLAEDCFILVDDTCRSEIKKEVYEFVKKYPEFKILWDFEEVKGIHMKEAWWSGVIALQRGDF